MLDRAVFYGGDIAAARSFVQWMQEKKRLTLIDVESNPIYRIEELLLEWMEIDTEQLDAERRWVLKQSMK